MGEVEELCANSGKKERSVARYLASSLGSAAGDACGNRQITPSAIPEARKLIVRRDPDDVDILALTLHLELPLWSNDNDFEGTGVDWYTTAELLKKWDRRIQDELDRCDRKQEFAMS